MKIVVVSLIALIALAAPASDPSLQWGEISSGVRLGIGLSPTTPEPALRLVFQNVNVPSVQIPLGGKTLKGPIYNMVFRITSPEGDEFPLFNMSGPTGTHMKIEPLVAPLTRGQKYEILLPMKKFVFLDHGKERLLPELLAAHYSVQAILDTTGNPRIVTSLALWAGDVRSGELRK
jgi:hypothetical protein